MKKLEDALLDLGRMSPFYLYMLLGMKTVETDTVKNLAVGFSREGDVVLFCNPRSLERKHPAMIRALLMHEVMHLINQHFLIRPRDSRDKKIWDLAMDAAVNQYIPELDALGVPLGVLVEEGHGVDNDVIFAVPPPEHPDESAEFYHDWMLKKFEELGRFDLEIVTPDDHEPMRESEVPVEMIIDLLKDRVGKAFNIYGGDLPSGVKRVVEKFLEKPVLSWRTLVRRFLGVSVRGERYSTPLRPNRRYEDQPGWRYEYHAKVVVVLDTSGSIIEDEINSFLSEIESLVRTVGGDVWLIQVDKNVTLVSRYRSGDWRDLEIIGGGETDLQPAVSHAEDILRAEGTIVFTDGHADLPLARRRIMFVLSKYHNIDFKREAIATYGLSSVVVID